MFVSFSSHFHFLSHPQSSINITRFLLDELRLTPDDTVVVKMDIEEAEWLVLGGEGCVCVCVWTDVHVCVHEDKKFRGAKERERKGKAARGPERGSSRK